MSDLVIRALHTVHTYIHTVFFFLCRDLRLKLCSKEQRPGTFNFVLTLDHLGKKKVSVLLSTMYLFEDPSVSHDLLLES